MTKKPSLSLRRSTAALLAVTLWLCAACASSSANNQALVSQSFSCNPWNDGWRAEADLLEYRYGDQVKLLELKSVDGRPIFCGRVNIAMPVAEFLFVKWRIRSTEEIVEHRVDLRSLLPKNMFDHEVTFTIAGRQLYVFVVTPKETTPAAKVQPPTTWLANHRIAYEIYPRNNQTK